MNILIISYSAIVKKRILPALRKIEGISSIDIASRSSASGLLAEAAYNGTVFNDYADAISRSNADLVYISLVNSSHAEWAEQALCPCKKSLSCGSNRLCLASTNTDGM
ncbi:MAG: hypothetical protein NTV89_04045 [Proteobacteria bacterium]|nr:hypothetical protein [Pseudomonadota bacterium]